MLGRKEAPARKTARRGRYPSVPTPREMFGQEYVCDDNWYMCGVPATAQGWKLYVSATVNNFLVTVEIVAGIARSLSLPYKYLRDLSLVSHMNSGFMGFSQIGKCIVIYVDRESLSKELIRRLNMRLVGSRGPAIPRLSRASSSAPVFYRYGSYSSSMLVLNGVEVEDERDKPVDWRRSGIEDPFHDILLESAPGTPARSLRSYPILGEFCRSGKGGVFVALDLSERTPTLVTVKIGLVNGQVAPNGRDARDLVLHESSVHDLLNSRGLEGLVPRKRDLIVDQDAASLVCDHVDAKNLDEWKADGALRADLIEEALAHIAAVNSRALRMCDAKASNVVCDGRRCWLIDLESWWDRSGSLLHDAPGPSTFDIDGMKPSDARFDAAHFLASCIYRKGMGQATTAPAGHGRRINLQWVVESYRPEDDVERFVIQKIREVLNS